jgi:hypothetical protein
VRRATFSKPRPALKLSDLRRGLEVNIDNPSTCSGSLSVDPPTGNPVTAKSWAFMVRGDMIFLELSWMWGSELDLSWRSKTKVRSSHRTGSEGLAMGYGSPNGNYDWYLRSRRESGLTIKGEH